MRIVHLKDVGAVLLHPTDTGEEVSLLQPARVATDQAPHVWVGNAFRLSRDEAAALVRSLRIWIEGGKLPDSL